MHVEMRELSKIKPYENNPRKNDFAIEKLIVSIKEFGFRQPLVVDQEGVIIVGHTRYKAALQMGLIEVPVHVANLDSAKTQAYRLADNRTNQESLWDDVLLLEELTDLKEQDFDLSLTGFNQDEIEQILEGIHVLSEGLCDEDQIPLVSEPRVQFGDIWKLGRHLLKCGDSTSYEDLNSILGEEKINLLITDPPYNVDYSGSKKKREKIQNDNLSIEDFNQFLLNAFTNCFPFMKENSSFYCFHSSGCAYEFQNALNLSGFKIRNQLIWVKNHFVLGWGRYKYKHEPIFYGHLLNQTDEWYGDKSQVTVLTCDKPIDSKEHPTMKPVELIEKILENSSVRGDLILDIFGGSGSTLIACEKTARQSRLVELNPAYCDAIIERWEKFTGKKAELFT